MTKTLSVVIVGAHPDDCEYAAGGVTIRYRQLGHRVTYISTTNGDAGHYYLSRDELKLRRYAESRQVAKFLDVEYEIMDVHDGCLEPTLENRENLIRVLRKYEPDIIITHPPIDYHADHRYTSQLVCDTAYLLNVPLCVPDSAIVRKPVVYCYFSVKTDISASATILVPVDDYIDKKVQAFHCNTSQIYDWLPWVDGIEQSAVPDDKQGRLDFLRHRWCPEWSKVAENYREQLNQRLGYKASVKIKYIEAFTACPYGLPLTVENAKQYFPFTDAVIF